MSGGEENGEVKMEANNKDADDGVDDSGRGEDFENLVTTHGLTRNVGRALDDIFKTGKLSYKDLDQRALEALKEFPAEGALAVLKQFMESSLEHVSNKSAYLCGVMKTYRQKAKMPPGATSTGAVPAATPGGAAATGGAGEGGATGSAGSASSTGTTPTTKGPNEDKIKAILERTGYSLDVTTGQRKYGGPPPDWEGAPPSSGCEVFVGKIPKDMFEDELIPMFEKCGKIWDLRLMMDPLTGLNRGYAFITFCTRDGAQNAVSQMDNNEIRKGKFIGVTISINNHRLFVGNIPKNRGKEELYDEFSKQAPGLVEVIIYSSPDDKKKNRGFCFLEYESHKAASLAKRRLGTGRVKVWGCDIIVDWADPQEEPDQETMSKVKVLYVRNLTVDVTEEKLKELFEAHGVVERVKKIKDYAFVHFEERENALSAMEALNNYEVGGAPMEISLAKPPSDKKKKEEILRNRERRMMQMMQHRAWYDGAGPPPPHLMPYGMMGMPPPPPPPHMRGRGRGAAMPPPPRPHYEYDYTSDFYGGGYGGGRGGYGEAAPYYDDYYGAPYDYDYDYYGGRGGGASAGGPPPSHRRPQGPPPGANDRKLKCPA